MANNTDYIISTHFKWLSTLYRLLFRMSLLGLLGRVESQDAVFLEAGEAHGEAAHRGGGEPGVATTAVVGQTQAEDALEILTVLTDLKRGRVG